MENQQPLALFKECTLRKNVIMMWTLHIQRFCPPVAMKLRKGDSGLILKQDQLHFSVDL